MLVPPSLEEIMLEPSPDGTPLANRRDLAKRHYKKDSRFVGDLYTLTFDTHEDLESLGYLDLPVRSPRSTCAGSDTGTESGG